MGGCVPRDRKVNRVSQLMSRISFALLDSETTVKNSPKILDSRRTVRQTSLLASANLLHVR